MTNCLTISAWKNMVCVMKFHIERILVEGRGVMLRKLRPDFHKFIITITKLKNCSTTHQIWFKHDQNINFLDNQTCWTIYLREDNHVDVKTSAEFVFPANSLKQSKTMTVGQNICGVAKLLYTTSKMVPPREDFYILLLVTTREVI